MTVAMIIRCEHTDPDRQPHRCRAFLVVPLQTGIADARQAGWLLTDQTERCPSHATSPPRE